MYVNTESESVLVVGALLLYNTCKLEAQYCTAYNALYVVSGCCWIALDGFFVVVVVVDDDDGCLLLWFH